MIISEYFCFTGTGKEWVCEAIKTRHFFLVFSLLIKFSKQIKFLDKTKFFHFFFFMPYLGRSTIEDLESSLSNVSAELREAGEEVT